MDSSPSNASSSRGHRSSSLSAQKQRGSRLDVLLIGLGDGTLLSFVVNEDDTSVGETTWSVSSRKEVSIGTRAINLVPFDNHTEEKGTCVLATGDRPTVVYLSGGGSGSSKNARLCYSNIHLLADAEDYVDELSSPTSANEPLVVNVAAPFHSSMLMDSSASSSGGNYSLCISDDSMLRLGMIDDIQKLHVSTHKLGMQALRVTYDQGGRLICVGCIDKGGSSSIHDNSNGAINMGNCVRFFDDTTFEEVDRFDLDPFEMILSMKATRLKVLDDDFASDASGANKPHARNEKDSQDAYHSFVVIGTAYSNPGDDCAKRGRIIVMKVSTDGTNTAFSRKVKQVAETQVKGAVFSISPFFDGSILVTINSKTRLCRLVGSPDMKDVLDLKIVGAGHHGHITSLLVRSLAEEYADCPDGEKREQLAIVGDIMRSISVMKYYPEYKTLEEVARDFNQNCVTAIEMLTDDIYLGAEDFCNIFALRRNPHSPEEEIRCRLDTVGVFNLGEFVNKFLRGSLVMAASFGSSSEVHVSTADSMEEESSKSENRKLTLGIGSQTLYATVEGSIGSIIGLDVRSMTFFSALQRAMVRVIKPVGNLKHGDFRSYRGQRASQSCRGFIDGDLMESFSELDPAVMTMIVKEMNNEGKWDSSAMMGSRSSSSESKSDDTSATKENSEEVQKKMLTVDDVLTMVEDMSMAH